MDIIINISHPLGCSAMYRGSKTANSGEIYELMALQAWE
jgi:hypothetical protein